MKKVLLILAGLAILIGVVFLYKANLTYINRIVIDYERHMEGVIANIRIAVISLVLGFLMFAAYAIIEIENHKVNCRKKSKNA